MTQFSPIAMTRINSRSIYGDNEVLIGKWFKRTGLRHEIFLSTKFGMVKDSGFKVFNSSAEYTREACEASLKAIETDYIDICEYFLTLTSPSIFLESHIMYLNIPIIPCITVHISHYRQTTFTVPTLTRPSR